MMRHSNIYLHFMQIEGGRLYEMTNTGQQEYDATLVLYGENTFVANPIPTFLASLTKSASKSSKSFHDSLLDGCTIT
jgi:hypothetical protein